MSAKKWKVRLHDIDGTYDKNTKGHLRWFAQYFYTRASKLEHGCIGWLYDDRKGTLAKWGTYPGEEQLGEQPLSMWQARLIPAWRVAYYILVGKMPPKNRVPVWTCSTPNCLNPHHFHLEKKTVSIEDFWTFTKVVDNHRIWTGPIHVQKRNGKTYRLPVFVVDGQMRSARKLAYDLTHEESCPPGHSVFATCDDYRCMTPGHLVARSSIELALNTINGGFRDRTHCKHGHEINDENGYRNSRGAYVCRVCNRERQQRLRDEVKQYRTMTEIIPDEMDNAPDEFEIPINTRKRPIEDTTVVIGLSRKEEPTRKKARLDWINALDLIPSEEEM
jgi:hypothetical protein